MNTLKKYFLLVAISAASFSFAQESSETADNGSATLDANYCLALDATTEVQMNYAADASDLGWTSAAHAKKMCGFYSNNLVTYKSDYENNQMLVIIHTDRTRGEKDVIWWNDYLLSLCK